MKNTTNPRNGDELLREINRKEYARIAAYYISSLTICIIYLVLTEGFGNDILLFLIIWPLWLTAPFVFAKVEGWELMAGFIGWVIVQMLIFHFGIEPRVLYPKW